MHAWEQIQQTIEYIENHISEEVNIDDLAKMASLSPFYYQRLFRRLVKKPVAEYVKLRRLAKATEELLNKDKRIIDIALDLGFTSHEHFSRSFKQAFGMTPDEYRKNPITLNRMTKPELLLHYVLIDEGVPLITNGIVLEINRLQITEPINYVGLHIDMPAQYVDGLGTESGVDPLGNLWDSFHDKKVMELGLSADSEELGVAYPSSKEGYFSYFAGGKGVREAVSEDCINWELPPGNYIVCSFEAESFEYLVMDALYKAQQYINNIWLPNHKLQTEPFCAERYASHSPDTTCMELWLKVAE